MNLKELLETPKPKRTSTYSPICHDEIHDTIMCEIKRNNYELRNINVNSKTGQNCVVMYGLNDLTETTQNTDIGIRVGFKNSYDRTMSFGFALGSVVFICGNGMVSGEYTIKKQHRMKDVSMYVKELIQECFQNVRKEHQNNIEFEKCLKQLSVTESEAQRIIGELFIDNNIFSQAQLRNMSKQIYNSDKFQTFTYNKVISGWDLYNHGTESLKTSANINTFNKHIKYNEYFRRNFGIWH